MALGEAARFATLNEAEVACSALRAAGIRAEVFDRNVASTLWTHQFAIYGVRVMAPLSDLAESQRFLSARRVSEPTALLEHRTPTWVLGISLAVLLLIPGYAFAWAVAVLRRRFSLGVLAIVVALATLPILVFVAVLLWSMQPPLSY